MSQKAANVCFTLGSPVDTAFLTLVRLGFGNTFLVPLPLRKEHLEREKGQMLPVIRAAVDACGSASKTELSRSNGYTQSVCLRRFAHPLK